MSSIRICRYCGKEFDSHNGRRYCNGPHYTVCKYCGKEFQFEIYPSNKVPNCCSRECINKLRRRTNLEKYGTEVASKSDYVRKKLSESGYASLDKRRNTCIQKYGVESSSQSPGIRRKISQTVRSKECKDRTLETNIERYSVPYAMQNKDLFDKHAKNTKCKTLDGTVVDSHDEKLVYDFCIDNHLEFETQIPLTYEYEGIEHISYIDFCIEGILFEVKGGHLLNGVFDYRGVPISRKLELYKEKHVVVITSSSCSDMFGRPNSSESNGLKYMDKCPNPLIGVDISLFGNPQFPYSLDRPKSFYDVQVSGDISSRQAFDNPSIRWKMIKNRILYSGGFIDSKQILNALNITRTCKQPSWFSKSFAKHIIQNYITSDVIVDPFAGWGARYDAAVELGKLYIGCDINKDLVDWHNSHGRDILLKDAKKFTYEEPCSVFICPPYQDIEYYVEGQDTNLTQCQWLSIVMSNVPDAREYVMVCKVVDDGWDRYIVETKVNKSHFGVNNEYVLVVPGQCSKEYIHDSVQLNILKAQADKLKSYRKTASCKEKGNKEHRIWVSNDYDNIERQIPESMYPDFINSGWRCGRLSFRMSEYMWINNGALEKRVLPEDVDSYISSGWCKGRLTDSTNTGKVVINDGISSKRVYEDELEGFLDDGWVLGQLHETPNKGKIFIHKGSQSFYVTKNELDAYLTDGWRLGRLRKFRKHIHNKETKQEKMVFQEELDEYLKSGWELGRLPGVTRKK